MIIEPAARLQVVQEYYFSKKLKEIKALNDKGQDIINLGIGSPDLPPSSATVSALTETALDPNSHGYQSYVGIPEFRQAIADWVNSHYGYERDPNTEILPLMGSKEGIMHISLAFLNNGDKVLVPNPGYPTYHSVSNLVQAEIISYDLCEEKNWNIDLQKLKSLNLDEIKLMWINFPNMPTGALPDRAVLAELILLAKKHKFLIINDNPYSTILTQELFSIFQLDGAEDVCLELNSLSKSHNMAGWRVGWISGNSDYLQTILKVKSNMDSGMFLGIQKAAIAALQNSVHWHTELNEQYARRKALVGKIYQQLSIQFDAKCSGLFVWGKIPDSINDVEKMVDEILYQANVFITPGFIFGSNGNRFVRVSLCATEVMIEKALVRIKNAQLEFS